MVAFRSASQATAASGTSFNLPRPSPAPVSGDLLIAFTAGDTGTTSNLTLSGGSTWNTLTNGSGSSIQGKVFWKIAGGSEPTSYTVGKASGSDSHASVLCFSDAANVTPVFTTNYVSQTGTSISTPSVNAPGSADIVVRIVMALNYDGSISWSPPSGHSERTDSASNDLVTGSSATRALSSSGATGTANFTASSGSTIGETLTVSVIAAAGSSPQSLAPASIASAEAFGSARLGLAIGPSSIASLEAFGGLVITTPQPQAITPASIASGEAFSLARLGLFVGPHGIPSEEAFGSPRLSAVIGPSSIASSEAFGATNVAIEQFIIPASLASAEAFGVARLQLGYPQTILVPALASGELVEDPSLSLLHELTLINPAIQETPAAWHRLFGRYGIHRGITLLKDADGVWSSVRYPAQTEVEAAMKVYLGGHKHPLTVAEAAELIAAGYGPYVSLERK